MCKVMVAISKAIPLAFVDGPLGWILVVLFILYGLYAVSLVARYALMRRASRRAGAPLDLVDLIKMRWRKVNPYEIIDAYEHSVAADLKLTVEQIEEHVIHGGRVDRVVQALALARSRNMRAEWGDLCQRDLDGENVVGMIQKRIEEVEKPVDGLSG